MIAQCTEQTIADMPRELASQPSRTTKTGTLFNETIDVRAPADPLTPMPARMPPWTAGHSTSVTATTSTPSL